MTETGEVKPVTPTGSDAKTETGGWAGYGIFGSLLRFVLGLTVALGCLVFAGWKPLANLSVVKANAGRLGVVFGVVGALAVLFALSWLAFCLFRGFGGALTLSAAGLFVVLMAGHQRGVLKAAVAEKVRPFGVAVGFACAGVTLVSLVSQGYLWVF